jgi:hypothetical protein
MSAKDLESGVMATMDLYVVEMTASGLHGPILLLTWRTDLRMSLLVLKLVCDAPDLLVRPRVNQQVSPLCLYSTESRAFNALKMMLRQLGEQRVSEGCQLRSGSHAGAQ